jgi:membrane peptidoglycan carboxypeptidase
MVQRWSAKLAATMRNPGPEAAPPMVRYRSPQYPQIASGRPATKPVVTRPEPWSRSRSQKITRLMRKRRDRWSQSSPNSKRVGIIITSVVAALLVILLSSGSVSAYAYYQSQLPNLQSLANFQVPQSTRIYDRNGVLLDTLYNQKYGRSTPISYTEIPGFLQDAQIAAEDKTFWTNDGIDVTAIVRSAFIDTSNQQIQTGASTITQQVVKNLSHQSQDTAQRKLSEAALAIGLTQEYQKWQILEMYFNISPYGAQEQGVEAAAQDFFGLKPVCTTTFKCTPAVEFLDRDLKKCSNPKDESTCAIDPVLGLARASLMAGIPQNPVIYDPLTDPNDYSQLLQRQDYVLNQMMADGMSINLGLGSRVQNYEPITPQIIQQAEALSKNFQFTGFQGGSTAPHFVRWIIQTLANELGNGDYADGLMTLEDSGLNIRTTLDLNLEKYVEAAVNRHINQPEFQPFIGYEEILSQSDNLHDSAVVVMDAKTGEVLAMDGSADFNDTSKSDPGQINMALSPRPPGSSFKPFVIATAYQMGWNPGIMLPDQKTYFPEGQSQTLPASTTTTYEPVDYGGTYTGSSPNIEVAISNSYNIPALKAEYFAGLQNVYNTIERLGITSVGAPGQALSPTVLSDLVPSSALGTTPISLLQMVDAYQTFADQGMHIPPQGILSIYDNYGDQLYKYDPTTVESRVFSPQVSYLVTSTLDNEPDRHYEFTGDHVLSFDGYWTLPDGQTPDLAAKTGTTDSFKDNWTVGFTPDVVVGVWSGNADNVAMENSIGVTGAAPIWQSVISYTSGHCESALDGIACPKYDLNYSDHFFTEPAGITQAQTNIINGLAGAGQTTDMISGDEPQQSGLGTGAAIGQLPPRIS